ncbi:MAG TPA: TonB-dependent receptor [Prosthecochloris aestuarii]|uniref:TonB-dependent receptor n=1 Tax=Prosthecochloris aestuarii TaxID=1102 RepID=A0A831SQL3_PROAE|nr:TonB-dependent receptor [Prosthecochloris aestuarii]
MILKKQLRSALAVLALCSVPVQGALADTVTGKVTSKGAVVPYANVMVKGTTIGTAADENGIFTLSGVPAGSKIIEVRAMGYGSMTKTVNVGESGTIEVNFNLLSSAVRGSEIVVTGSRDEVPRKESPVIVSKVSAKELTDVTQSTVVSEGLNLASGLRVENDCQNCGFNQLRMNGLEGPYSQILIDGRAVFSAVAGVYGLEMIPTNMIERIEVVRGGGSALYGSNAIGGTVNLILKDPVQNSYEFSGTSGWVGVGGGEFGDAANDYTATVNASVVSDDNRMGMTVFGFYRDREPFDANSDGFSELAKIKNTTLGLRAFKRIGDRGRLTADLFTINEERRGGNRFDELPHESDVTEGGEHNIVSGALTYDQYFRDFDKLSLYVAAQDVLRDMYYGGGQALDAYGRTDDLSLQFGAQYKAVLGPSQLIAGIENNSETLVDEKLGYYDKDTEAHVPTAKVADQESTITGVFGEYQYTWNNLKATFGLRWDTYEVTNNVYPDADVDGDILLPRATLLYSFSDDLQARVSYAEGYRAPQIFDEDLHVNSSASMQIRHENAPGLKEETSSTYTASLDYNTRKGGVSYGFLAEGFYTELRDAFRVDIPEDPDEPGGYVYTATRYNAGDATVQGVNLEAHVSPSDMFAFRGGVTIQKSEFEEPDADFGEKKFFRSPDTYGFVTMDWEPTSRLGVSLTGNYTGEMLVPHEMEPMVLNKSDAFFDAGIKVRYTIPMDDSGLQLYGGVKNIFNSYQDDFDTGEDRDPGYVYGPLSPRTFYVGVKLGNLL